VFDSLAESTIKHTTFELTLASKKAVAKAKTTPQKCLNAENPGLKYHNIEWRSLYAQ
jgi:hypothetical protein